MTKKSTTRLNKRGWQKLSSKVVYQNQWIKIIEDQVIRPDGQPGIYAYMNKGNGSFVIAMDKDTSIYLIEEYRYPIKKTVLQLPAGMTNGSDSLNCAKRELFEETGINAKNWQRLGGFYQGPGHETIYDDIYLATDLDKSKVNTTLQEADESILNIIKVSLPQLKDMVKNNQIECAMTTAALNLFFLYLEEQK